MKKFLIVLLLAAASAYFYLPYHTTEKLEEALRTSDKAELERLIDFPALRQSVKDQMKAKAQAQLNATVGAAKSSSAASVKMLAAMGEMAGAVVDSMVTPDGLTKVLKLDSKVNGDSRFELREKRWVSPVEFTARAHDRSILRFRFAMNGGWRLVAMEMSEEMAKAGSR